MKYSGLEIISINNIIHSSYVKTCDNIYRLGIDLEEKNRDIVKLLYNELILQICDVLSVHTTKSIFYFTPLDFEYLYTKQISSFVKKIQTLLPITVLENDIPYEKIHDNIDKLSKDFDITINKIKNKDNCKFKLDKLMQFLEKNDLRFLHNAYKRKIHLKMSLIR